MIGDGCKKQLLPTLRLWLTGMLGCVLAGQLFCSSVAAQSQPDSSAGDSSSNDDVRLEIEPQETFARPAEVYQYLVYQQAIQTDQGQRSRTVKQRLPSGPVRGTGDVVGGQDVSEAEPLGEADRLASRYEEILQPYNLRRGKRVLVREGQVSLLDPQTGQEAVLLEGPNVEGLPFVSPFARTALSPSGEMLAVALLSSSDGQGLMSRPGYDLYVVDLLAAIAVFPKTLDEIQSSDRHRPRQIGASIWGEACLGSSVIPHAIAPLLFWLDDQTVLVITADDPSENASQTDDGHNSSAGRVITLNDDGTITKNSKLVAINTKTAVSQTLFTLQIDMAALRPDLSPELWRRSDGAIMLRNSGLDYRIDIQSGEMVQDRKLSAQYELRGDRFTPSLWYGEDQLSESIYYRNISLSPDGRSIAWYARSEKTLNKTNLGNTSQYLTTLWYHSPETGLVELAEGQFQSYYHHLAFDNPGYSNSIQWLSHEGLPID